MTNIVNFENAFNDHKFDGSHRLQTDFDANGHLFKNLAGFGGSAGKAVRLVSTYAELKAACEDAAIFLVICLQGTFTGTAHIAATAHTHILGIGHVQIDGGGSGWIFDSGANCIYENLHFINTGANYSLYFGAGAILRDIICDTGIHCIAGNGDNFRMDNCHVYSLDCGGHAGKTGHRIINSSFDSFMRFSYLDDIHFDHCKFNSYLNIVVKSSSEGGLHINDCEFINNTPWGIIVGINGGPHTTENWKITNNTFDAAIAHKGIEIKAAGLTINDLWLENNTYRDMATGLLVTNGTLNRPRFINNRYDNITNAIVNNGTINNPVYCMDGP